ncbi:MAG TPA: Ku protein [Syntrophorhabdaceae bacterium]|nr:Ku protein [Syntrophorhabdaceae bacterium]
MARRAIWKGYLHFQDMDVPVKLHTTVREQRVQFNLLHKRDKVRLRQEMICAYEQVPVPSEEIVKGYEFEEGRYVLFDKDEIAAIEPEDSRMIEIHEFVKSDEIDPLFRDRAYYLEPEATTGTFAALREVLEKLNVEGICTWTMRKRSYLGSLQAHGRSLRLNSIRYADEIIPASALDLPDADVSEREQEIGIQLINQMTASFQPDKYENEHQKKLQDLIERKTRGEKITILRPRRLKATTPDTLLDTLRASLKKVA